MVLHVLLEDKDTLLTSRDWGKNWVSNQVGGQPRSASTIDMASNQTGTLSSTARGVSGGRWTESRNARSMPPGYGGGVAPGVENSEFTGRRKWGFGRRLQRVDPVNANRFQSPGKERSILSWIPARPGSKATTTISDGSSRSKDFFAGPGIDHDFCPATRDPHLAINIFATPTSDSSDRSTGAKAAPANSVYAMQFHPNSTRIRIRQQRTRHPRGGATPTTTKEDGVVYSDDRGDVRHTLGIPRHPLHLPRARPLPKQRKMTSLSGPPSTGTGGGLYRSDDSGLNWRQVKGLGYPHNDHFLEVLYTPNIDRGDLRLLSCTRKEGTKDFKTGRILYSSNDGNPANVAKSSTFAGGDRFALVPSEPGTVYLATSTPPWYRQGGVYWTRDSGKS